MNSVTPELPTVAEDAVERLAGAARLLVALDFDGTLSTLVDDPMEARMDVEARAAIDALVAARQTTVALVSGRSLHDLRVIAEHDDASPIVLVGSHGAERWVPGDGADADGAHGAHRAEENSATASETVERDRLRQAAEDLVADVPGAWIEPKTFGFAVPSRKVAPSERSDVHARVDALMAAQAPHWRRRTGRDIVEYAFRNAGKDGAVAWLREYTDATTVLFAGDDVTDEDALRSLSAHDVGVRIGEGPTAASVRLDDIPQLATMLACLAHARSSPRE